jgi:radical SAM-linked protein
MRATSWALRSCWRVSDVASGDFRLRVRYGKTGRLRWLSHLEVLRAIERSLRRSGLPFAITQGFSPHMRVAFGPALPVGTGADSEYYDVWLTRYTSVEQAFASLTAATPDDLKPTKAGYVAGSEPSLTAAITIARYHVAVDGKESQPENVRSALESIVAAGTLETEHKGKLKVYDLAHCLPKEACVTATAEGSAIDLHLRMGPSGSLRPDVLLRAALDAAQLDASVAHTTRTDTLIEEEGGLWARPL